MGTVIDLASHRAARRPRASAPTQRGVPVVFSFDVASPFTYLAAERVERSFPGAVWEPVSPYNLGVDAVPPGAEHRAQALRMPLVWPDVPATDGRLARRVAAFAADRGRGASFALAAGRLAYAGGFDLDDPAVLVEAAAAAGLPLEAALDAAEDAGYDERLAAAAHRLSLAGAADLPVLEIAGRVFAGEERLAEAVAASA